MSDRVLTAAGELSLTRHVVERYIERIKPAFSHGHALAELTHLLPQAEVLDCCPPWMSEDPERHTDCWLVLCDSIAFPVWSGMVMTVFSRGTFGPVQRAARSQQHRWRRTSKRSIERKNRSTGARKQRKANTRRDHRIDYGEAA